MLLSTQKTWLAKAFVWRKNSLEKKKKRQVYSLAVFPANLSCTDSAVQLREIELKVQREIQEKRAELLSKEEALRGLETRLAQAQIADA